MDRFCLENPSASICRQSSWGGGCGAFTCDGDAVQCAIAREIHKRDCTLFDTETSESTLGRSAAAGTDSGSVNNPASLANRETQALPASLDQTAWLGGGTLSDETFVITPDVSLTIPWSSLNAILSIMGAIVVAFSFVAAARIVFSRA